MQDVVKEYSQKVTEDVDTERPWSVWKTSYYFNVWRFPVLRTPLAEKTSSKYLSWYSNFRVVL